MARAATLALLLATLLGLAPAAARAQACADTPPDWRPHVAAHLFGATRVAPGQRMRADVYERDVFCRYGDGPPPPNRVEATIAGAPHPARIRRGRLTFRAPDTPGDYVLELRSVRLPNLVPGRIAFRVADPSAAVSTEARLELPRDRLPARPRVRVEASDGTWRDTRCQRRRDRLHCAIDEAPGDYRLTALGRSAPARLEGAPIDVRFGGSHVRLVLDGLPVTGDMHRLSVECADGTQLLRQLHERGADLGDDVPPGPATLTFQGVRRIDPWDPDEPSLEWRTLRTVSVEILDAAEQTLRWSSPSLFAGADPRARAWTEVVGAGRLALAPGPRQTSGFVFAGSSLIAIGDAVWERGRRWRRWRDVDGIARGPGLRVSASDAEEDDLVRIAPLARRYAWIEGGPYVSFRTLHGVSQESLPLYAPDVPYPCGTTGIAVSDEGELAVSGRCRGNSPARDTHVPHGGFVAVRGPTEWTVHRFGGPLRDVAFDGSRIVAVGDQGRVVSRVNGAWTEVQVGEADYREVAFAPSGRLAARANGVIVWIGDPPVSLHGASIGRVPQPARRFCFAGDRLVVWHGFAQLPNEGSGPDYLPDEVMVRRGPDVRSVARADHAEVRGIACDGDRAWLWRRNRPEPELIE